MHELSFVVCGALSIEKTLGTAEIKIVKIIIQYIDPSPHKTLIDQWKA